MAKHSHDYIIVGSGLTGAVIARELWDAGRDVLVIDRRTHVGGNVHDHVHKSGIRIHTYGPHYFRTNSDELWEYVNRFTDFHPYVACIQSLIDGRFEQWPISGSYIRQHIGIDWTPEFTDAPTNFEEASLSMMPKLVYEKFVKGYTEKQWGCPARQLSAQLARRFDVRDDDDPRLFRHHYQGIPRAGYASFMQNMLNGIPIMLGCDYLRDPERFPHRKMLIFTGPIDELFGHDLGRLHYRGQKRIHQYIPDREFIQPCGQVNNPDLNMGRHIRTIEWKHMLPQEERAQITGTVVTREYTVTPSESNSYEYPFPDEHNANLYAHYRARVQNRQDLLVCGRLGEYRYYDMDQAIARALTLATRIVKSLPPDKAA